MFDEDGRKIEIQEFPRNLEGVSIEDLKKYVEDLKQEIARVEADIDKKAMHQDAASKLFS